MAQVVGGEIGQVEKEVSILSVRDASNAFCKALKSGVPSWFSTTISPSSHAAWMPRVSTAVARALSLAVQSLPLRVKRRARPCSMRASSRYPSNLIS